MYDSIDDLPFVCRLNLPEPALHVYRDAFNRSWKRCDDEARRHRTAQADAWREVRRSFERDALTGRWIPRTAELKPRTDRTQPTRKTAAAKKRSAR